MTNNRTKKSSPYFDLCAGCYTIPAGRSFADDLANGVLTFSDNRQSQKRRWGSGRLLADMLILLPSYRAKQSFQTALIKAADGQALLLPTIRTFDEVGLSLDVADEVSPLNRQLILARLIAKLPLVGAARSPAHALSLAGMLADFLDQIYLSGGKTSDLEQLIPDDFAMHWGEILKFLDIIFVHWPSILAEQNQLDKITRQQLLIDRQIAEWKNNPPQTPVILAGSTGSRPKTIEMMQAVANLPHLWPASKAYLTDKKTHARTEFLTEIFRPAEQSWKWRQLSRKPANFAAALDRIRLINAKDIHHEADIIAGLMRQTLETPSKTAMLVTLDRALARQTRAALLKWDLDIDDSDGMPLLQTRTGSFLGLIARWFDGRGDSLSLLALARHPLTSGGMRKDSFDLNMRRLELAVLRGYLSDNRYKGIENRLASQPKYKDLLIFYRQHILGPLSSLRVLYDKPNLDLAKLADAHGRAAEALAETDIENEGIGRLWDRDDGKAAAHLLEEITASGAMTALKAGDYMASFQALCANAPAVQQVFRRHPRLAIMGTIDARMSHADLVIIGGVNEGIWPPQQQADPWSNQRIRDAFGLPDKYWRNGVVAHDFFMLASCQDIIITRAIRDDNAPTTASRWLQRLDAVLDATKLGTFLARDIPTDIHAGIEAHICMTPHHHLLRVHVNFQQLNLIF